MERKKIKAEEIKLKDSMNYVKVKHRSASYEIHTHIMSH